jgi:hypothetical protein
LAGSISQSINTNTLSPAALAHCALDDAGDEKARIAADHGAVDFDATQSTASLPPSIVCGPPPLCAPSPLIAASCMSFLSSSPSPNASLAGSISQSINSNTLSPAALAHCALDDAGDEKEQLDGKEDAAAAAAPAAPAPVAPIVAVSASASRSRNQRRRANKKSKQQQQALLQQAALAGTSAALALPPLAPGVADAVRRYLSRAVSLPPPIDLLVAFYQYDVARCSSLYYDAAPLPQGAQVYIAAFLFFADAIRARTDQHLTYDGQLLRYSERPIMRLGHTFDIIEHDVTTALSAGMTDPDKWWSLSYRDYHLHKFLDGSCLHWRLPDSPSAFMGYSLRHFWYRRPTEQQHLQRDHPCVVMAPPQCCVGDFARGGMVELDIDEADDGADEGSFDDRFDDGWWDTEPFNFGE